jgi:hypothetical protein
MRSVVFTGSGDPSSGGEGLFGTQADSSDERASPPLLVVVGDAHAAATWSSFTFWSAMLPGAGSGNGVGTGSAEPGIITAPSVFAGEFSAGGGE